MFKQDDTINILDCKACKTISNILHHVPSVFLHFQEKYSKSLQVFHACQCLEVPVRRRPGILFYFGFWQWDIFLFRIHESQCSAPNNISLTSFLKLLITIMKNYILIFYEWKFRKVGLSLINSNQGEAKLIFRYTGEMTKKYMWTSGINVKI